MGIQDLTREGQSLVNVEGRSYDVLQVVGKDGTRETRWFDIQAFFDAAPPALLQPAPGKPAPPKRADP